MMSVSAKCLFCFMFLAGEFVSAQTLTVAWRNKPPHQYLESGVQKGILFDLSKRVFAEAAIPVKFVEEPAKRIWHNFNNDAHNYCSFGWYKNPERENLVQFSLPMYRDLPHTIVVGPTALAQVKTHQTLAELLADSTLTLALVEGVSYGVELDAMLKMAKNKRIYSSATPMIMAGMIKANRASYMLIDRDDWDYLRSRDKNLNENTQIDLPGMPTGIERYIVCSKDVSAERMQKINSALAKIKGTTFRSLQR